MSLQSITAADGVRLHYLPIDKFKTNFMSVSFIAPLEAGTNAKNSLIPNILLRGTQKYPDMAAINKKLDYLYASGISTRCSKRGELQVFGFCADMLDSSYAMRGENLVNEITDILEELIFHPITVNGAFDPYYVESEKQNQIDAINSIVNNPAYYAFKRCVDEMCADERFGLSEVGTVEDTEKCTPTELYEHYKYALKHYPVEIFFVGQCDVEALIENIRRMFSHEREPIALPKTNVIRRADTARRIDEDMPVNQGKLVIGMRSGVSIYDEDYPAVILFNAIFGGSVTSKLFMNVREKMSLCYYCQSAYEAPKGLLMIQSGIENSNREIAEKAVFDQLEAVKNGDFTDEELDAALISIISGYNELSDSARGLEGWYLGRIILGIDGDPCDMVERLKKVKREDVIRASNMPTTDVIYFLNGTLEGEEDEDD